MSVKESFPKHECKLKKKPEDVLSAYIDTGICVGIRRTLKRITMISRKHPLTNLYINSANSLRQECYQHLVEHNHMIHPLSMFAFWFNVTLSVSVCVEIFLWLVLVQNTTLLHNRQRYFFIQNALSAIQIVLSFFTGYFDHNLNMVVMEPRLVAKRYLLSYFVTDVVKVIVYLFAFLINEKILPLHRTNPFRTLLIVVAMLCFARVPFILQISNDLRRYFGLNQYAVMLAKIIIALFVIIYFGSNVLLYAMNYFGKFKNKIRNSITTTFLTLFLIKTGYGQSDTTFDRIYPSIMILLGIVIHLVLICQVMQLSAFYHRRSMSDSIKQRLEVFCAKLGLAVETQNRLQQYLIFKHQKQIYKEQKHQFSSETLLREVSDYVTLKNVNTIKLLKILPQAYKNQLITELRTEIYLPYDYIIREGSVANCIYFILAGTVDITTANGKHVCFLRDGEYFGEIGIVTNMNRVANVMAVTPIEVLRLSKRNFLKILDELPSLQTIIQQNALARVKNTENMEMFNYDTFKDDQMAFWNSVED